MCLTRRYARRGLLLPHAEPSGLVALDLEDLNFTLLPTVACELHVSLQTSEGLLPVIQFFFRLLLFYIPIFLNQ